MSHATRKTETDAVLTYLNNQRAHVLGILEGLDEEALRHPMLSSGWSCLGVVQHLAIDVERFWFRGVAAGDQEVIDAFFRAPRNAWHVGAEMSAQEVFELYRREIDLANEIIAATPLETEPNWWPDDLFGNWRPQDLRTISLHTMTETATHAGHLDTVRELIDGKLWLVLD